MTVWLLPLTAIVPQTSWDLLILPLYTHNLPLAGGIEPICIKLSRLDYPTWLALCTTLPGRSTRLQQLLTGFSLPFLFAQ
jgi:hypothetical protein